MLKTEETLKALHNAVNPRRLHLTILPTEACNFACPYCYETHKPGLMKPGVVKSIKRLLDSRANELSELELTWFGGEPLLAPDLILEICEHAQNLARKHGFAFASNATTNGSLLTLDLLNKLTGKGVSSYQISLDGMPSAHDSCRPAKNGRSSFEQIWGHLLAMKRSALDFSVILRIHYTPRTLDSVRELIDAINNEFRGDRRFRVFFKAIAHLGAKADSGRVVFGNDEAITVRTQLYAMLHEEVGRFELSPAPNAPYVCYAAALNAFVVKVDGAVTKCTVDLYSDKGVIGQLEENGQLSINEERLYPWISWIEDFDGGKLSCPKYALKRFDSIKGISIVHAEA
jgi:uncharacterized protein